MPSYYQSDEDICIEISFDWQNLSGCRKKRTDGKICFNILVKLCCKNTHLPFILQIYKNVKSISQIVTKTQNTGFNKLLQKRKFHQICHKLLHKRRFFVFSNSKNSQNIVDATKFYKKSIVPIHHTDVCVQQQSCFTRFLQAES